MGSQDVLLDLSSNGGNVGLHGCGDKIAEACQRKCWEVMVLSASGKEGRLDVVLVIGLRGSDRSGIWRELGFM